MNITVLALLAAACGGFAIYLFAAQSKLHDTIKQLRHDGEHARADAKKEADRAEALRKKLDSPRSGAASKDDKPGRDDKDIKAQLVAAREQVKQLQAAVKRGEIENNDSQIKLRRAEARVEELGNALHHPPKKVALAAVVIEEAPAPPPVPEREPELDADREERMERSAARRAELEAERTARLAEAEQARAERDAARAARQESKDQEFIAQLKDQREHLKHLVFVRELDLRILERKAEHNRRAYMMTLGALDLAEDELYRLKHGRERPEFVARYDDDGNELAVSDDRDGPTAEVPVDHAATAEERAGAQAAADAALATVTAGADLATGTADAVAAAQEPEIDAPQSAELAGQLPSSPPLEVNAPEPAAVAIGELNADTALDAVQVSVAPEVLPAGVDAAAESAVNTVVVAAA
ncbi:MAG: hypothetical protein EXR77_08620 [Myxococcales bacterium]|nr:hypothetical protein [Myxococcales bacterium]